MFLFEKGNIIGDEDLIINCPTYRTTVKCISLTGLVGVMKKDDFMRLEFQTFTWNALNLSAKNKELAISRHLQLKNNVESGIMAKIPEPRGTSHVKVESTPSK